MASKNSRTELTLIVLVVVAAAAGFTFWLKGSVRVNPVGGLAVGERAPVIQAGGWLNGEPPPPSDLAGRVVVVNAWFTTCPYCHVQAPELVAIYEEFHSRGAVFIGLTYEDPDILPEIEESVRDMKMVWPNGYGALETLKEFQAEYFPATWVIGGDGRIVWNNDSNESLEAAIENALAAVGDR